MLMFEEQIAAAIANTIVYPSRSKTTTRYLPDLPFHAGAMLTQITCQSIGFLMIVSSNNTAISE